MTPETTASPPAIVGTKIIDWTPDFDGMTTQPVMVRGMPDDTYFALPRISASLLSSAAIDDYEFDMAIHTPPDEDGAGMDMLFGKALHAMLLEPIRFRENHIIDKDIGPASIAKMRKAMTANPGKFVLAAGWPEQLLAIYRRCTEHPVVQRIVLSDEARKAEREVVLLWVEHHNGVPVLCKAKLDYWHTGWKAVLDIKTSRDARPSQFERTAEQQHYPLKAAWYKRGIQQIVGVTPKFGWLVMEREKPHRVNTMEPGERCIEQGWGEACKALATIAEYFQRGGVRPPPPKFIDNIDIPAWGRAEPDTFRHLIESLTQPPAQGAAAWPLSQFPKFMKPSPTEEPKSSKSSSESEPARNSKRSSKALGPTDPSMN
jgi:hypothetical protein